MPGILFYDNSDYEVETLPRRRRKQRRIEMSHRKKTGITIALSILICLIGLVGSIAGSLRYALRDKAVETLTREWELSQMQITKIADRMSMAQFFVVMVDNPGIDVPGAERLLDAEYTRNFIAAKLKDFREDLLHKTGKGRITFGDIALLEEENRDAVAQDLQYRVTSDDMERYEIIWDNLGLEERFILDTYRGDRPVLFALAGVILSNGFLIFAVLLTAAAGVALWLLNGYSFSGHRAYGVALLIVGAASCALAASCGVLADMVNRFVDMRSNLMTLFFTPVSQMALILGVVLALLGAFFVVLSVMAKRKKKSTRP